MNSHDVWMPFYWGDYWRDTVDLTNAEHGVYIRTIGAYWCRGESLPDKQFRAICGREFDRVSQFYVYVAGRWHHKRIDQELAKARARIEMSREKARKMVEAKRKLGLLPPEKESV
jgi:uncharacterized protein YdaU (DUF1376 family)